MATIHNTAAGNDASSQVTVKTSTAAGQYYQGNPNLVPFFRPLIVNGTINPPAQTQPNTDPVKRISQVPLYSSVAMSQPPIHHHTPFNNWARNPYSYHPPAHNTTIPIVRPPPKSSVSDRPKFFKPMDAITLGASSGSTLPPYQKIHLGFSPNYKGDATNVKNRSANIHPSQSTSLYLTNIPNGCSVKHLLDALTPHGPFGKVWQVYISPGTKENGYSTSAAKVAMFTREGAEKIFEFVKKGGLVMGGLVVRVAWNRVLVPEQERKGSPYLSRVLVIEGDDDIVNFENLERYFRGSIVYQLQDVRTLEESQETGGDEKERPECDDKMVREGGKLQGDDVEDEGAVNGDGGKKSESDTKAEGRRAGNEAEVSKKVVGQKKKGTRKMEWVFGSYRAQAQTAKMALKRRWPELSVRHGIDPVAVGLGGVVEKGEEKACV